MDEFKPESAHDNFLRCFRAGDLEGLVALYESDATMVLADGTTHAGQAAIRAALGGFLAVGRNLELKTRYAARNGDLALLSNEWRLQGFDADGKALELSGRTAEVVRRHTDGRWRYVVDHPWGGQ